MTHMLQTAAMHELDTLHRDHLQNRLYWLMPSGPQPIFTKTVLQMIPFLAWVRYVHCWTSFPRIGTHSEAPSHSR